MYQEKGVVTRAPCCARSVGEGQCFTAFKAKEGNIAASSLTLTGNQFIGARSPCSKHRRSASRGLGERGKQYAVKHGMQGRPSVHVGQGGRSQRTRCYPRHPLCCGHEVLFSLPQSVAFAAGTIVHADVVQRLPVGGVEDDTQWQWGWAAHC
jgi:hypothetical protein